MKKTALLLFMACLASTLMAQERTTNLTVYKNFKPSIILLKDGRVLKQPLTNIFLKNSSLLYLHGTTSMQANMDNIVSVKFDDRLYNKIDTVLAYEVDSVGDKKLYKATIIDQIAYRQQLRNNQVITNLQMGDQLSTTTMNLNGDEDYKFPLIDLFFYRINGKIVKVHERDLSRVLSKEQKRMMRTFLSMPDFSWTDEKSLMELLRKL
jgi:hypothetical protein